MRGRFTQWACQRGSQRTQHPPDREPTCEGDAQETRLKHETAHINTPNRKHDQIERRRQMQRSVHPSTVENAHCLGKRRSVPCVFPDVVPVRAMMRLTMMTPTQGLDSLAPLGQVVVML